MNYIEPLFFGLLSALIGIIPPGLINMTAAKISLKEGRRNALSFVFGAVLILFFQTYIAIFFARIINASPEIIILLREVGFIVFFVLTIYFFFIAKTPKLKKNGIKSKKKRFFLGMLLSALNFFPIPYYVFVSITLLSYNLFSFLIPSVFIFVSGVVLGSLLVFYCYIVFFQKIERKADYLLRNINSIIGTITGLVSLFALYNILQYYWL